MAVGLDDRLRRSAALPRGELDMDDVRRRALRHRWSRRVLRVGGALVLVGIAVALTALGVAWLEAGQLL